MLSKKAKYAIRAIEYIVANGKEAPVRIADIATVQRIPKKFLEVILLELKRDGLLNSVLGKNGGYTLRKSAEEISLGHVIRLIDGPIALVPCVSVKFYSPCQDCPDPALCALRIVMGDVREQTGKILENFSFADMAKQQKKLKRKSSGTKN